MAQTYLSRFLAAMSANESAMRELFQSLATFAAGELTRHADGDGNIPRGATFEIQRTVGERVTAMFVANTGAGRREPFQVQPNGSVLPLAPYPRILWNSFRTVTRLAVEQHANLMRQRLTPDLVAIMRQASQDPFVRARQVAEMGPRGFPIAEQVFRPNPLAQYNAPHTWVDPAGHTLSDRIWNTAGNTRRRLDLFLEDAIRRGRGALDLDNQGATGIARDLEAFLLPGRSLRRTSTPYGVDVSFDAMRLARTEIARAHAGASEASAAMNPFVRGLKWTLSRSHKKRDICDDHAEGGPNGDGVYPLDNHPTMPAHPQDLCHWQYAMIGAAEQQVILDELREDIRRTRAELVTLLGPLAVEQFTNLLLTGGLETTRAVAPVATGGIAL